MKVVLICFEILILFTLVTAYGAPNISSGYYSDIISRTTGILWNKWNMLSGNSANSTKCDMDRLNRSSTNCIEGNESGVGSNILVPILLSLTFTPCVCLFGFVAFICCIGSRCRKVKLHEEVVNQHTRASREVRPNLNASATIEVPKVGYRATMIRLGSDLSPTNNVAKIHVDSDALPSYNSVKPMAKVDELPSYSEAIKMGHIEERADDCV